MTTIFQTLFNVSGFYFLYSYIYSSKCGTHVKNYNGSVTVILLCGIMGAMTAFTT